MYKLWVCFCSGLKCQFFAGSPVCMLIKLCCVLKVIVCQILGTTFNSGLTFLQHLSEEGLNKFHYLLNVMHVPTILSRSYHLFLAQIFINTLGRRKWHLLG